MKISDRFDSGNIEVIDASNPRDVQLSIRADAGGDHRQWFHFRIAGAQGVALRLRIVNASAASYPAAWAGYEAVTSEDRQTWRRVATTYHDGELVIEARPQADVAWFAYFAPYSQERTHDLVAWAQVQPGVGHQWLGATVEGRDMDLLTVGTGPHPIWVIARQHPGESMAAWWVEGFLRRLLDPLDDAARRVREQARVHVVPCMNPDGAFLGHLRNNAAGANLNREWHDPTLERSPEVKHVRDRMIGTGVDLCLDVHGDEELPYNFVAGAEGIPGWTPRLADLEDRFLTAYIAATPAMQRAHGYPKDAPGQANLTMCTAQIAQRFDCLSLTIEQPFKDTANRPMPEIGWSPERAMRFGAAAVHPISAVLPHLR